MKKIVRYFNWELKNEFIACGYFSVMLLTYCIIKLILGNRSVDIFIIFEMCITNYFLSTLQRMFFDDEKEYSGKSYILRALMICIISVIVTVTAGIFGGWFDGMPLWAGITIYVTLILTYLMVWFVIKIGKKYDTKKLNEQLDNFKRNNKYEI